MITDEMVEAAARVFFAPVGDIEPSQRALVRAALEAADKHREDFDTALKSASEKYGSLIVLFRQTINTLGE